MSAAEWELYRSRVKEGHAAIRVDMSARDVHGEDRPYCLMVAVELRERGADGTGTPTEETHLAKLEARLAAVLTERCEAVGVGWITKLGRRELLFYASHPGDLQESVEAVRGEFPAYKLGAGLENDPSWSRYLQALYPRARDLLKIQNRRQVAALAQKGDKPDKKRKVGHWLHFPTVEDRKAFLTEVQPEGFKSTAQRVKDDEGEERPFALQVSRDDTLEQEALDELTLDLWDRAQVYDGEYRGWESQPAK